jgi:biotin carboxyl carrier protein
MKLEHAVVAARDGAGRGVEVEVGQQVVAGAVLVTFD